MSLRYIPIPLSISMYVPISRYRCNREVGNWYTSFDQPEIIIAKSKSESRRLASGSVGVGVGGGGGGGSSRLFLRCNATILFRDLLLTPERLLHAAAPEIRRDSDKSRKLLSLFLPSPPPPPPRFFPIFTHFLITLARDTCIRSFSSEKPAGLADNSVNRVGGYFNISFTDSSKPSFFNPF